MRPIQSRVAANPGRVLGALLVVLAWCASLGAGERGPKVELTQDDFRAAILSKLLPYISSWPDSDPQVVVGVVGKGSFVTTLRELVRDQKVQGREVVVKEVDLSGPLPKCHVLFVPASSNLEWLQFSQKYGPEHLLTVGEAPDFASSKTGGVLRLIYDEKAVEVNPQNARKAGYEINSKLLKIFRIVR
jgi:hypothetical protein